VYSYSNSLNLNKEEIMKRLTYLTVVLMIILMSLGFATVPESTANPTAGTGSLVSTVGNKPFIGDSSAGTLDLNGWNPRGGR
jgi:hypothetical protein